MKPLRYLCTTAGLLALTSCSTAAPVATDESSSPPAATTSPIAAPTASGSNGGAISGTFDANGHSLFLTCVGYRIADDRHRGGRGSAVR